MTISRKGIGEIPATFSKFEGQYRRKGQMVEQAGSVSQGSTITWKQVCQDPKSAANPASEELVAAGLDDVTGGRNWKGRPPLVPGVEG
ncbi:hypothetical protein P7K49_004568 [Saguinus oedipus]|uniref:Uncharacterized protein n=1 Tax=Saguinus oedipus TaxID=9490 RepID=A0ABQ9W8H7_SAGOE|nr:hypothetical protein P7K49_004568 [Saguinus oedipus]